MNDFVDQVNRANIPELRVEYSNPKTPDGGNNFILHANSVTFADGTSDLPSVLGIAGLQVGDVVVATGTWECFTVGTTAVDVLFGGVPVIGAPFTDLNFTGTGVTSVVDAGSGRVDITISGGGGPAYGVIIGDTGTATATVASETITFGGIGIDVVATDAGAGLDTILFNLDISDLPAGGGTPVGTDTIAINDGGTTVSYPLSSLAGLFGGVGYGSIAGGDGGTATATTASELITFNGTGINITSMDVGAGADTTNFVLDIEDLPDGVGPLTSTDEIAVDDGGTTQRFTLEEVKEAVLPGITITFINGQPMLTLEDTTRGDKILSVAEQSMIFSDAQLSHLKWLEIGDANDGDSGYIMDFDGTLVYATGHCENTAANSKDIHLFINGVDNGSLGTLSGGANSTFTDVTLDIDFNQGDKIRLQAQGSGTGSIEDTVVKITVKWRG